MRGPHSGGRPPCRMAQKILLGTRGGFLVCRACRRRRHIIFDVCLELLGKALPPSGGARRHGRALDWALIEQSVGFGSLAYFFKPRPPPAAAFRRNALLLRGGWGGGGGTSRPLTACRPCRAGHAGGCGAVRCGAVRCGGEGAARQTPAAPCVRTGCRIAGHILGPSGRLAPGVACNALQCKFSPPWGSGPP